MTIIYWWVSEVKWIYVIHSTYNHTFCKPRFFLKKLLVKCENYFSYCFWLMNGRFVDRLSATDGRWITYDKRNWMSLLEKLSKNGCNDSFKLNIKIYITFYGFNPNLKLFLKWVFKKTFYNCKIDPWDNIGK